MNPMRQDFLVGDRVYVFYNRAKNKLKLLAYHRNGFLLIYKQLDKKRFTLKEASTPWVQMTEKELSWLLAGLDWVSMTTWDTGDYTDYY